VTTELAGLLLAGSGTALATGLGAVPVFLLGPRAASLRPALWGFAAGSMGVASVVGLLLPGLDEGSVGTVVAGLAVGIAFLLATRRLIARRRGEARGLVAAGRRRALLVFLVLLVHSLPEGLAIGTAYASSTAGLGLFVIVAIAVQNVPEGTAMAIPMEAAGDSRLRQFWVAVLTSVPQPVGAVLAYVVVDEVNSLLPFSFAFAAGAMLALVLLELVPQAFTRAGWPAATLGALAGAALLLVLSAALGV
jgi:ZIP family zinc transporter